MASYPKVRAAVDLALLASLIHGPWWGAALIAGAGLFFFPLFAEAAIAGFLLDALYGTGILTASLAGLGALGLVETAKIFFSFHAAR